MGCALKSNLGSRWYQALEGTTSGFVVRIPFWLINGHLVLQILSFASLYSAQQDYESERRLREEKVLQLQEEVDQLTATKQATSQEQEQYQAAVNKYKEDHYRIQ